MRFEGSDTIKVIGEEVKHPGRGGGSSHISPGHGGTPPGKGGEHPGKGQGPPSVPPGKGGESPGQGSGQRQGNGRGHSKR